MSANQFQPTLTRALEVASAYDWTADMIATNGHTVSDTRAYIDAQLAAQTRTPVAILVNLGSNDGAAPEADFKADFRYVIEALHTKYSAAAIYLARPVRLTDVPPSSPTAGSAAVTGWINDLIAEYDYVYAGIDETALEGGDDYVTNLADTTHPTAAGYALTAALWQTVMGY